MTIHLREVSHQYPLLVTGVFFQMFNILAQKLKQKDAASSKLSNHQFSFNSKLPAAEMRYAASSSDTPRDMAISGRREYGMYMDIVALKT